MARGKEGPRILEAMQGEGKTFHASLRWGRRGARRFHASFKQEAAKGEEVPCILEAGGGEGKEAI